MKPLVIFSTLIEKPHCVVLQVRAAAAAVELATAGHRLAALNVCFAYDGPPRPAAGHARRAATHFTVSS